MKERLKNRDVPGVCSTASVAKGVVLTLGLSLLSAFASPAAYADPMPSQAQAAVNQNEVTGTVTDSEGEPLVGVNVRVEDTNKVATTDIDGRYKIAAAKGQTLSFAYVGFHKSMVKVT